MDALASTSFVAHLAIMLMPAMLLQQVIGAMTATVLPVGEVPTVEHGENTGTLTADAGAARARVAIVTMGSALRESAPVLPLTRRERRR